MYAAAECLHRRNVSPRRSSGLSSFDAGEPGSAMGVRHQALISKELPATRSLGLQSPQCSQVRQVSQPRSLTHPRSLLAPSQYAGVNNKINVESGSESLRLSRQGL